MGCGENASLQPLMARLEEWAEWYSRMSTLRLGYPPISPLYRLGFAQGVSAPFSDSHAAAEEIEGWVCEMAEHNPDMAITLRAYYFHPSSLRQHAAKQGISHSQFKFLLGMAHQWLVGRMWGSCPPKKAKK